MNQVKIEVSTKMLDSRGRETVIRLSSDFDADYTQLLVNRAELLERCEKAGWKALNGGEGQKPQAVQKTQAAPQNAPKTANQAPNCKCGFQASIHEGTAKTGRNAGKPYVRWTCAKRFGEADRCDFVQYFSDEAVAEHLAKKNANPPRDLELENQMQHENTSDEDIPF